MGWQPHPGPVEKPKYIVCWRTSAILGSSLLSTEEAHLSLAIFYYLASF